MTIDEVLRKFFEDAYNEATFHHKDLMATIISQAKQELEKVILDSLPEERKPVGKSDFISNSITAGYNLGRLDCQQAIKKMMGEG